MGKIETRKRDCRRSVGIKYKIKPLKKWFYFCDGGQKICEVKGGEAMQRYFRELT